jgi:hypothetical protein
MRDGALRACGACRTTDAICRRVGSAASAARRYCTKSLAAGVQPVPFTRMKKSATASLSI